MITQTLQIDLVWSSDWIGEEVGYPDIDVVGCWTFNLNGDPSYCLYIDYETNKVLEITCMHEEE